MSKRQYLFMAVFGIIILVIGSAVQAHKPLLAVEDNQDGTIYIEAGFSDGSSAAGHKILLKEEASGKLISEHRVGEDGTLELKKPTVPYTVTLDAGEGHAVTREGPKPAAAQASAKEAPKTESPAEPKTVKATVEKQAPTSKPQTAPASPAPDAKAQQKPGTQAIAQGPPAQASAVPPAMSVPDASMSAGAFMAFKMMMITQIVTSVALIVLVVIAVYYVGYRVGRNSVVNSGR